MSRPPQNEFDRALRVLRSHHEQVVRELAEEIIKNADDFDQPFGNAETILDSYNHRLCAINQAWSNLQHHAFKKKPEGTQALAKNEFRCFGCGGTIKEEDSKCSLCGWTWK